MRRVIVRGWLLGLLGAFVGLLLAWWFAATPESEPKRTSANSAPVAPASPAAPAPPPPAPIEPAPAPAGDGAEPAVPWAAIDLEEIRRALPDNLFWQTAAPTDDERIVQARDDERARWNVEYGKVLSGNASEAEIQAYYAHRRRLSADYVEFTTYVLDHHGSDLTEQDVTLLELARRLHLARLEEYPRQTQLALERKQEQDRAREAWRAEEAELGNSPP